MSNRNADELMEELYSVVERAWRLPLSGGKAMVDGSEVKQLLDELRDNLPQETRQARAIVADRNQIIADAKREAEGIVRAAEERAKRMVQQDEITKQATEQANSMLNQAAGQSRQIRKATNEYVEDLLRRVDDTLAEGLSELRKTRQGIKAREITSRIREKSLGINLNFSLTFMGGSLGVLQDVVVRLFYCIYIRVAEGNRRN